MKHTRTHCSAVTSLFFAQQTKDQQVLYLIQAHHSKLKPVYPHLLPHSINLGDKLWFSLARKAGTLKSTESFKVQLPGQAHVKL